MGRYGALVLSIEDQYSLEESEKKVLWDARESLVVSCMEGQGFSNYRPQPYMWLDFVPIPVDPFIGVIDRGHAEVWGFHEPVEEGPEGAVSEVGTWPDRGTAEGDAFYLALEGGSLASGCLQEASTALYGEGSVGDGLDKVIAQFKGVAEQSAVESQSMERALDDWRRCMREGGYDDESPAAIRDKYWGLPLGVDGSKGAATEEVTAAIADLDCKEDSDLVDVYRIALWSAQEELVSRNRPALEEFHDRQVSLFDQAALILREE
jgi:hypothetical protein